MGFHEAALSQVLERFPRPSGWLVAYSGGLDSSVLLHTLSRLRETAQQPLRAVHVQHGLLPHADAWSRHCAAECARLEVPLEVVRLALKVPSGESIEAFARTARYAALAERLQAGEMLLTGQHQDDQAETLLLQLLRGAGIEGLAGMPACRKWQRGWQARPLLDFSRAELRDWALAHGIEWVEDVSNQDLRFDRNYLRHEVMPRLLERWPGARHTLARSAGHLAASLGVLREEAGDDLQRCREEGGTLRLDCLAGLSIARRAMVIRAWIQEQGHQVPGQRRMQTIERQVMGASPDRSPCIAWADVALRRYRNRLCLTPHPLPAPPSEELAWPEASTLRLPPACGELQLVEDSAGIPRRYWSEGRVSVRWPRPDLRCRLAERAGSRSLKKLCQEWGVPPWERPYLPLVYVDERLAAIAGIALCEGIQVRGEPGLRLVWTGLAG